MHACISVHACRVLLTIKAFQCSLNHIAGHTLEHLCHEEGIACQSTKSAPKGFRRAHLVLFGVWTDDTVEPKFIVFTLVVDVSLSCVTRQVELHLVLDLIYLEPRAGFRHRTDSDKNINVGVLPCATGPCSTRC